MLTIRFFRGNPWNPLHLLIMAVTRSRVVHCDILLSSELGSFEISSEFGRGVLCELEILKCDIEFPFDSGDLDFSTAYSLIGTPYDYRAGLAYIWPWVRQSPKRMNCVEVCLWAMTKAGLMTPKYLPTPGGLRRWCEKLKKGEVK